MRATTAFTRLGLPPDADERAIRKAYALALKQIDQDADPAAFQSLREAYDSALAGARNQPSPAQADAPPAPADAAGIFGEFLARCAAIDAARRALAAPWREQLEISLANPRLHDLAAREQFEQQIADLLASGWRPGHEALFVAAIETFGWEADLHRVRQLGRTGMLLDAAIKERASFTEQAGVRRYAQGRLIARLRDATPPTTRELLRHKALVKRLPASYPHWLPLITSTANIAQWRQLAARLPAWKHSLKLVDWRWRLSAEATLILCVLLSAIVILAATYL